MRNLLEAFATAGWLMIGTGLMGWYFDVGDQPDRWLIGSLVVGGGFVITTQFGNWLMKAKTGRKTNGRI